MTGPDTAPGSPGAVTVTAVPLERVLPLRAAWSYDGRLSPHDCIRAHDLPSSLHLVASADGHDLAMVSLAPDPRTVCGLPVPWRFYLLAVDPAHRHRALGSTLVREVLARAAARGATSVWASARTSVLPLYLGLGATVDDHTYDVPLIGPHRDVLFTL